MSSVGGEHRRRLERRAFNRVERALEGRLEPGETLESAFFAHRYVPGLFVLLFFGSLGDLIYILVARPYYPALTNRRFFLLNGTRFGWVSRPRDAEFTADAGSVRIDESGRRFVLRAVASVRAFPDRDVRLAVHRQYWRELEHMRSILAQQASG
ncbi:MAG TPA: hypothetical protein VKO84_01445 [Gaiellaceae bacterium]|nr:hypothetical protein [Gaiellaceae bacterium]